MPYISAESDKAFALLAPLNNPNSPIFSFLAKKYILLSTIMTANGSILINSVRKPELLISQGCVTFSLCEGHR